MKILLACAAGMSTTLLEKAIKDYAASQKIEITCDAVPTNEAKGKINQYDVVLLGPQVGFELATFKKLAGSVPVAIVPGPIYALAKGKETIEMAEKMLKEK